MKKILTVLGTRPEAIKLFPLILKLNDDAEIEHKICVTGQHKEMLDSILSEFNILPDYDLSVMRDSQTLSYLTESILAGINAVLDEFAPEVMLVHGDTTTAFTAALAGFYRGIKIGHVEAGLRSGNILSPFPEEFNRRAISLMASLNFAPTHDSINNLLNDSVDPSSIFLTGNTVIDTIKFSLSEPSHFDLPKKPFVIMTLHRREHSDAEISEIFNAIRRICGIFPELTVIYPVHKNPRFRHLTSALLKDIPNMLLSEPIEVKRFHRLLNECEFVLTDSGGIQEEAAFLGKRVLILRDTTERPEGLMCGNSVLVGSDQEIIFKEMKKLLENKAYHCDLSHCERFGNGKASERIVEILKSI